MTCIVVDALAPGLTVSVGEAKLAVQPLGTGAARLRIAAEQLALSVLVTAWNRFSAGNRGRLLLRVE